MRKVIPGVNDLKTVFPEIASEAFGWDPSTCLPGSGQKQLWLCPAGHSYEATPGNRTGRKSGCPFCSGNKILSGFNDLETKFPTIAAQVKNENPRDINPGSNKKIEWVCEEGHTYLCSPWERTGKKGVGCPYCAGKKVWIGFNDFQSRNPEIASEAHKWDPQTVTYGSSKKQKWKCDRNHIYEASPKDRSTGKGCPFCAGNQALGGFNDLHSQYPEIARDAYDWDTSRLTIGSSKKQRWKCEKGHIYEATIKDRTGAKKVGCPFCANKRVLRGFNDLLTKYPDIAKEAIGWDPSTVIAGTRKKYEWICPKCSNHYEAAPGERIGLHKTGCPNCAEYGFSPGKPAWLYLMERPGEQQIGITNHFEQRMKQHNKNGWELLDSRGPLPGREILDTETKIKRWLKDAIGVISGTYENWESKSFRVLSLHELKERGRIKTTVI